MDRQDALLRLIRMQMGYLRSACLYVAARLEIADRLADGAKPAAELAAAAGTDPERLYRILRFLASEGVFEERPGPCFAQNALSEMLRTDVEGSYHPFAVVNTERGLEAVLELLPGVQSGEIPFVRRFGKHPFQMLQDDAELAKTMERAWQGVHGPETAAVLDGYDFTGIEKLADIGGGHGDVIIGFLERDASRRGAIFDIPTVTPEIARRLGTAGLSERCEVIAGDFFEQIPVEADAFFLRHILHDWNDDECTAILGNIAKQAQPGTRVLIAETVVAEPNLPDPAKLFDMVMLVFLSGKERTADEYCRLLEASGFEFVGVTPTDSIVSVVEGRFPG